uniref:Uncharacterized protein n=1 Tax=Micrurus lemniscatus lemniscatus TaxID=129467 RepID=A0A2D4HQ21_MICLE
MLELVENRARQIESHSQCFQDLSDTEKPIEKSKQDPCQPERSSRRPRRQRTSESRDICHISNGIDEYDDQPLICSCSCYVLLFWMIQGKKSHSNPMMVCKIWKNVN